MSLNQAAIVGILVASFATSFDVAIADAKAPKLLLQLGHTEAVKDADLFRTGGTLHAVTVAKDKQVKVWNAKDGSLPATFDGPAPTEPERVLVARGGRYATSWPRMGKPWKLDLQTGEATELPFEERRAPNVVCRSNDRKTVALLVAPMATGTIIRCRFGRKDRVVALGDRRGFVSWLDVRKKLQPIDRRKVDSLMIDDLDQSPDGKVWAVKGRKDMVLWDIAGRKELARFRPGGSLGFVRYTRDGKGAETELRGRPDGIGLSFSPDSKQLLVTLKTGGAVKYNVRSGAPIGELKGPALAAVSFSRTGELIAGVAA
ncbi:MAG: WD40 repeat protein, partial [Myxococcota bacterium]